MAKIINQVKLVWLKGVEAVGTSASNLASNAKHKVTEINLETRRREILTEASLRAFDMWQKGEKLPDPLNEMFQELSELDEKLSVLRAQRYADVGREAENAEGGAAETEDGSGGAAPIADASEEASVAQGASTPEQTNEDTQAPAETGGEGMPSPQDTPEQNG